MAEGTREAQVESAAATTVEMLITYTQKTGRTADPDAVRKQAAHVLSMEELDDSLLEDVILKVEHLRDISLDGFFIVPSEADAEGEPTAWQPTPSSPLLDRYLRYLGTDGWSPDSQIRLRRVTHRILARCGNPTTAGTWSRRGMVVGDVQSGKTTSYVSLICAAIDAGYRNIVVLGGRTNDLRHQTQERIDLGVTGIESSAVDVSKKHIGVGLLQQIRELTMLSLTSQDHVSGDRRNGGDFDSNRKSHNNISGTVVCIAVIKKHAKMIDNVAGWLANNGDLATEPLLLIDDEADDASINTKKPGQSPTAINGAIRAFLKRAGRSTYVAYTATPYANVMIDPTATGEKHGEDLFPRDFIALLTPPPTYFGARRFLKEQGVHPRTVVVPDAENWIAKTGAVGVLPESLREAIREFVLVSAVRRARRIRMGKERQHETMLVHASVRTGAHSQIDTLIQNEVDRLQAGWDYPVSSATGAPSVEEEFAETWRGLDARQDTALRVPWEEMREHITRVFANLRVETINGVTKAGLDYRRAKNEPLTVIAVGGTKLSRGLTLEGLTTSYHLRSSNQHDTLMQMCRWFGYRIGYEDLCRLHAQTKLLRAFTDIMESDEELRTELEDMTTLGATPLEFGIRIRTSPGMTITAPNKLRRGLTVRDALAGKTLEVTRTAMNDGTHNDEILQGLVSKLGAPVSTDATKKVWHGIPWETLQPSLGDFREMGSEISGLKGKIERAMSFVREAQRATPPRLRTWTVVLAGREQGEREDYGGMKIVRVQRTPSEEDAEALNFGAISDPSDEQLARGAGPGRTRGAVKSTRPREEGLLIIYPIVSMTSSDVKTSGVAISFPRDDELRKHNYVLNPVAQLQEQHL
ncbi:Z1 domain-containing protein [Deinococcus xianganensis]|uniref:Putative endonuclease Z1 domain-containing protein n=1 Tax=Deinococcus xianganensis TaxID=1507289 RepID=A0A6I4YJI7_9DEIO|nr:Z1 domain-containing protein [Deinococcus xianganensis]MXV19177.1 hypothetical protein [Deinococcus xianganensis]